ncbi:hypothetical protein D3C71_1752630 [compost metagenome]
MPQAPQAQVRRSQQIGLRQRLNRQGLAGHGVGRLAGGKTPEDGRRLEKARLLARSGVVELALSVLGRAGIRRGRQCGTGEDAVGHGNEYGGENKNAGAGLVAEHGALFSKSALHSVVHFLKK